MCQVQNCILARPWLLLSMGFVLSQLTFANAATLSERIDNLIEPLVEQGQAASIAIAIDKNGETLLNRAFGFANIENGLTATPETIYRIGSITKQFTAVAIIQLESMGKLNLDDTITTHISDYPMAEPITIRNLLQHTSGIPDFTRNPSHHVNVHKDMSHAEMRARFEDLPLDFKPGSKWSYSNSGYYLLGLIIEVASGQTYSDYLEEHVLGPVGLDRTQYETPDGPPHAEGYRPSSGAVVPAQTISMTQPFAAGALVSSIGDLLKWQRALIDQTMPLPDAFERITSDTVRSRRYMDKYGYGIELTKLGNRPMICHGGGIEGFGSMLAYFPENGYTIAILVNTEGFNVRDLLRGVEAILSDEDSESEDGKN